jgi:hypothetical protein
MPRKFRTGSLVLLALSACALGLLPFISVRTESASADDSDHTTSFSYSTEGSANTILASFQSTDTSDASATITLYFTKSGQAEKEFSGTTKQKRNSTGLWAGIEQAIAFTTSTSFRARFTTYDSGGGVRWYYDRYLFP